MRAKKYEDSNMSTSWARVRWVVDSRVLLLKVMYPVLELITTGWPELSFLRS